MRSLEVVRDQPAGDAQPGRCGRQSVWEEPGRFHDLVRTWTKFATSAIGAESHHEAAGEGPSLAVTIREVLELESGLFEGLAMRSLFQALPCLDEAGNETPELGGESE